MRLFLNVGKTDGMFAREIIGLLNKNVHGEKVNVGRIDLMRNFSFVEVAEDDADRVIKALKHGVKRGERQPRRQDLLVGDERAGKRRPSREERGYTAARGKKYTKDDWMKFLHPDKAPAATRGELVGDEPDFSEEG